MNNIPESSGRHLGEMLVRNDTIKSLDLHWNKIRGEGAVWLFEGLGKNEQLRQLDVSWNSIGQDMS